MTERSYQPVSVVPPLSWTVPASIVVAATTIGVMYLLQGAMSVSTDSFLAVVGGTGILTALLFGPSRLILTVFFVYFLTAHQSRSLAIFPFAGVEWHPRELLLLTLLAHGAIKFLQRRYFLQWSPLHLCILLFSAFFLWAAWRGLWLGAPPKAIIAELRAPLFLCAFWVVAGCVRRTGDIRYYGYWALCVVTLLALATVGLAAWATLTGPWPNTQNALGEFVPRSLMGIVVQSVRPSGHVGFEVGLVLCLGMLCSPTEPWFRRLIYLALAPLFALAIAAGMMRTALVAVAVSLLAYGWLSLPRVAKGLSASIVGFAVALTAAWMVFYTPWADLPMGMSLQARMVESAGAWEALKAHPFFGAGLGASFEGLGLATESSSDSAIPVAIDSLHNVWLYFAWKGGLVGLGVVVLALTGLLLYSAHVIRRLPTRSQRCFGRALQAVLIGQLAASCAMPRLTYANGALFLVFWTMAFVLLERDVKGSDEEKPPVSVSSDEDEDDDSEETPFVEPRPRPPVPNVSPTLEQL